ncbi:Release factor glutamine methyltransferase [Collinsella intestinalis]|jgi:release factor glutamine methyltransferase|uniref:Release factor glutamine methyltransferase n=1 Tax=Collinsella intestinalis TaxID=147207 RepID=A0A5K1IL37_9ACTN|nr:HemK/PrmC family methyltransferase [Collinsella intestinalis]VWL88071.1 Release factor glutamine methyltransferase [Collinsella intestinalis]
MANETWTIRRCLDWTRDYLKDRGDERPRLSAEWLLSGVTGLSRTEIYVNFDKPMSSEELAAMHTAVVRRAKGEPLQYIIGETSFRTIDVMCEPGVLIPRPETELLVEEVLAYLDREVIGAAPAAARGRVELPWNAEVEAALQAEIAAAKEKDEAPVVERQLRDDDFVTLEDGEGTIETADGAEGDADVLGAAPVEEGEFSEGAPAQDGESGQIRCARVLEVGCGTGCISLSIASERSGRAQCVAIDIEPRAVDLSIRNRDALGISPADVDVRLGNLVSPLNRETEWGTFDVLVSNPPYIPSAVMESLPHEVADFEPALALDGGADGLDIFRRLVNAAPHMLRPGGLLACELYEGHLDAAADLCRSAGMHDVRIVEDFTGRPRIVLALVG